MLALLNTDLQPAFAPAWTALEDESLSQEKKDTLRAEATRNVSKILGYLDTHLAHRHWLVEDQKTVADAYLPGIARWAEDLNLLSLDCYPHLTEYLARIRQDESVLFASAIEDGLPASRPSFKGHIELENFSLA